MQFLANFSEDNMTYNFLHFFACNCKRGNKRKGKIGTKVKE